MVFRNVQGQDFLGGPSYIVRKSRGAEWGHHLAHPVLRAPVRRAAYSHEEEGDKRAYRIHLSMSLVSWVFCEALRGRDYQQSTRRQIRISEPKLTVVGPHPSYC